MQDIFIHLDFCNTSPKVKSQDKHFQMVHTKSCKPYWTIGLEWGFSEFVPPPLPLCFWLEQIRHRADLFCTQPINKPTDFFGLFYLDFRIRHHHVLYPCTLLSYPRISIMLKTISTEQICNIVYRMLRMFYSWERVTFVPAQSCLTPLVPSDTHQRPDPFVPPPSRCPPLPQPLTTNDITTGPPDDRAETAPTGGSRGKSKSQLYWIFILPMIRLCSPGSSGMGTDRLTTGLTDH